ncbi:DegT/DnrJ/EryC1/StrS family aminotransferase [uncultured Sunxiuqinia sp.]|uniref:DegT/DnrJ/EryC1/StrS family aminotransferase n=1 Tax=uncultured Sunxiuqinia sp. TaxID=1573825 RepID=UPI002AA6F2E2|nr:DegT/DnrJ/EryC1/StrS family aminotransferase [uncultured Sunxiuqinia sp.]
MKFNDLNKQYSAYQNEIDAAIQSVIKSTSFINGNEINLLESELADFSGAKHAITCSSGTDALLLSLMALNVQPADEIICPAFSFIASASMVSFYKARPVFVDVSPIDFNIDVTKIEEKITPQTKGIIAVSLYGQCADLDAINTIAKKYGLWVIEDGAQSFGAVYHGKRSCSITDIATTSFFPAKPLGCYGDGGAIFTNDSKLANKIKMLRSHGQKKRYVHKYIGINGRIDTIQAAILRVKLKYFENEIERRQQAAELYLQLLDGKLLLPEIAEGRESVWAQYTVMLENRDQLKENLTKLAIPTSIHYPIILPKQEAFQDDILKDDEFEVASLLSETVLSLPIHAFITEEEVKFVSKSLIESLHG